MELIHIFNRVNHQTANSTETSFTASKMPTLALTVDEMANELRISRPTAYELVKQDGFPSFHIGNRILVNRQALQEWINRQSDNVMYSDGSMECSECKYSIDGSYQPLSNPLRSDYLNV